jgi:hypothetical protein
MKKFILVVMLFMTVLVMNAQVAYEKAKTLDNMYLGVSVGATTPLTFNHMFPVNPTFNLKLGKELTPSFGLEIDGTSWFGDNGLQPSKTFFKATNVGLNGVLNLSNILCGYKGYSRCFELKTVTVGVVVREKQIMGRSCRRLHRRGSHAVPVVDGPRGATAVPRGECGAVAIEQ